MRSMQTTLYSVAVPAMFLVAPLMDTGISEVGAYVRGTEFRTFISEVVIQLLSGIVDALILGFTTVLFQ
jgi:hypothetical protein